MPPLPQCSELPIQPPANVAAKVLLFLSGFLGGFIAIMVGIVLVMNAMIIVMGWMLGEKLSPLSLGSFEMNLNGHTAAWFYYVFYFVSYAAYRGLRSRRRHQWIYWATIAGLTGWCLLAFTHGIVRIGLSGVPAEVMALVSKAVSCTFTFTILALFVLSRKNLEYFRITRRSSLSSATLQHLP